MAQIPWPSFCPDWGIFIIEGRCYLWNTLNQDRENDNDVSTSHLFRLLSSMRYHYPRNGLTPFPDIFFQHLALMDHPYYPPTLLLPRLSNQIFPFITASSEISFLFPHDAVNTPKLCSLSSQSICPSIKSLFSYFIWGSISWHTPLGVLNYCPKSHNGFYSDQNEVHPYNIWVRLITT